MDIYFCHLPKTNINEHESRYLSAIESTTEPVPSNAGDYLLLNCTGALYRFPAGLSDVLSKYLEGEGHK